MSDYSDAVLADSPLLYLRFEETSGATCANSGSLGGNATANGTFTRNVSTGFAGLGVAIDLGGTTSDYVTYPDTAALDITGDVTYECWVYLDNPLAVANTTFISKGSDDSATGGYNFQRLFNGNIRVQRDNIAVVLQTGSGVYPTDSNWHHLAFTRAADLYTIYLDGSSVASGSDSTPIQATSKALHVGFDPNYSVPGNVLDGKIDEVAVYNTALSAARIAVHYAAYNTVAGTTYTKVSYAALSLVGNGDLVAIYAETRYATVGLVGGGAKLFVTGLTYAKTARATAGLVARGVSQVVSPGVTRTRAGYAVIVGVASGRAVRPTVSAGMPPATIHVFTLTPNPADMFALTPHPVAVS